MPDFAAMQFVTSAMVSFAEAFTDAILIFVLWGIVAAAIIAIVSKDD
jgi:hypothetical protein